MENIYRYKTIEKNNGIDIDDDTDLEELKENLEKDHAYVGGQYLYLKDKLTKNAHYTNLRNTAYKQEKMKIFDESYRIIYIIYWILFTIYGLLFLYRGQYNVITSIITIILMGAYPFYIHDLSFFIIKGMRYIYKEVKNISIYIPNVKGEEAIADVADSLKKASKVIQQTSEKESNYTSNYAKELDYLLSNDQDLENLVTSKAVVEDYVDTNELASNYGGINNADYICVKKDTEDLNNDEQETEVNGVEGKRCFIYNTFKTNYYEAHPNYENTDDGDMYWVKNSGGVWKKEKLSY